MQELLVAVARGLVENKDAVAVTVDDPREDGPRYRQAGPHCKGNSHCHARCSRSPGRKSDRRDRLIRFSEPEGLFVFAQRALFSIKKENTMQVKLIEGMRTDEN